MKIAASSLCLLLLLACCCTGCGRAESRAENARYMRGTLGKVILDFKARTGHLPNYFDEALNGTSVTLPHRGDYYGNALVYTRTGPDSFLLRSCGPNDLDEDGACDDLDVVYRSGWVSK
jgi:hypothetical protein